MFNIHNISSHSGALAGMLLHNFNTCTHTHTHEQTAQHAFQNAVQPLWYSLNSYRFFALFCVMCLQVMLEELMGQVDLSLMAAHLEPFC